MIGIKRNGNPIKRPQDTIQTGKQAKKAREKKLPNAIALNAMAEIFASNPSEERDIFTSSVIAMLMSAPSRISEILTLPADCEVTETDKYGVERYGWRFFAAKGYEGDIKWIPTEMVDVAKEAVQRALRLSHNARKLAKWIEEHPDMFYRHRQCPAVDEDTPLTADQVAQALGDVASSFSRRNLSGVSGTYTLRSLWLYIIDRLPKDFPWFDEEKGIRYSNALFALNRNQLSQKYRSLPVELYKPSNTSCNADLGPRLGLRVTSQHCSIFERHGYRGKNGEQLKLNTSQIRHLLNTIAQRGGLSNLEIAKWSGRSNVKQNRTYNHMSEYEMVSMAEALDTSKSLFGPMGEVEKQQPVTAQEFNTLEQAAVHVTEYGYCVHDFIMSPCEKYRDCLNCREQVYIKGEVEKVTRLKGCLVKSERMFTIARKAMEEGDIGADRWYQYHEKTVIRLRELIGVLEDPRVPDGAQIKLKGNDFSQMRRVAEKKSLERIEKKNEQSLDDTTMLKDLTIMPGGGFG